MLKHIHHRVKTDVLLQDSKRRALAPPTSLLDNSSWEEVMDMFHLPSVRRELWRRLTLSVCASLL